MASPEVKVGQVWRRKSDGVAVVVESDPRGGYSFAYVRRLDTERHYEVTPSGLARKYDLIDEAPDA